MKEAGKDFLSELGVNTEQIAEVFCGKDADVANRAVKMFKGNYIYKKEGY